jgi:methionyl-tRNA formyltransferase
MRIVFMGTPEFAVPSLRSLHACGHELALVVTQPDRGAGRGRKVTPPPVKVAAVELGLPVEQYETVNTDEFVERLRALAPDLLVVVAFGQILSEEILDAPSKGAVNVHASLLPAYRGVAPINWAIVRGETETGVTTMFMAKKVDAGEIILARRTDIGDRETAGELSKRLSGLGAELLLETVELIRKGEAPRVAQSPPTTKYARKLRKKDGEIDWSRSSREVFDHIRGMTPWPGAYTWYRGKSLAITRAEPGEDAAAGKRGEAGEILSVDDGRGIEVAAGEGSVWLSELKPEGKRAMEAAAFVRGYRPGVGTRPFERDSSDEEDRVGAR